MRGDDLEEKEIKVCHTVPGHAETCKWEIASMDKTIVYTVSLNKKVCLQMNGEIVA